MGKLKETRTRSIVKAVIWRIIALAVTYATVWFFTGSIETSIIIALIANLLKTVLYYALERMFQRIEWGVIK